MKLHYILSGYALICLTVTGFSASAQTKKTVTTVTKTTFKKASVSPQEVEEGKTLITKSDCMGCHNPEVKMVGPAYITIAQTYPLTEANITALSQKIIAGGSGKWGQIPMAPHPAVNAIEAKKMVKYILTLKAK